jgi:hypothetical protein
MGLDPSIRGRIPSQWDDQLDRLRTQLPAAPEGLLAFYVKYIPWVAIIGGVIGLFFGLLSTLGALVFGTALAVFGGGSGAASGFFWLIGSLLFLVASLLSVVGGVKMRQLSLTGWWILAAAIVLSAIQDILGIAIVSLIITALVAWIHVQVKPRYS